MGLPTKGSLLRVRCNPSGTRLAAASSDTYTRMFPDGFARVCIDVIYADSGTTARGVRLSHIDTL
jgi:hypothetical protein